MLSSSCRLHVNTESVRNKGLCPLDSAIAMIRAQSPNWPKLNILASDDLAPGAAPGESIEYTPFSRCLFLADMRKDDVIVHKTGSTKLISSYGHLPRATCKENVFKF